MKIYLASRFSRLPELNGYAAELAAEGIDVTSRWLRGGHEWEGTDDDALPQDVGERFAAADLEDIDIADLVVCFTEAPRSGPSRGGRHVEFGYALATKKPVIIVGHRENVFYCLPHVCVVLDWRAALAVIRCAAAVQATGPSQATGRPEPELSDEQLLRVVLHGRAITDAICVGMRVGSRLGGAR